MPAVIKITVNQSRLGKVKESLRKKPAALKRAVAGAINDTAKHERAFISSQIREKVNIKKKDLDKNIHITRATPENLSALVVLEKTARIPLKYFGAKQTNHGVTYRVAKSGGRSRVPDAFGPDIPRLGGNVFRRRGQERLPIIKLQGPSAWGVFQKYNMSGIVKEDIQAFLDRRLKWRLEERT
jgi:hypothetical protein